MQSGMGLPQGFEDLAPFVAEWGPLQTQDLRYSMRLSLLMERITARANHPDRWIEVPALEVFTLRDGKVRGLKAFYYDTKEMADP